MEWLTRVEVDREAGRRDKDTVRKGRAKFDAGNTLVLVSLVICVCTVYCDKWHVNLICFL